jgi:hypothetical protein
MSNVRNQRTSEDLFECFQEAIAIEEVSMDLVLDAMKAAYIKTFPDLHDALWAYDSELYCQSLDQVLYAFIKSRACIKQFERIPNEL